MLDKITQMFKVQSKANTVQHPHSRDQQAHELEAIRRMTGKRLS